MLHLILVLDTAMAVGAAGLGVPVAGGALCTPDALGPQGLAMNPAAASSLDPELMLDVGLLHSKLEVQLDGQDPLPSSGSWQPIPTLGVTVPLTEHLGLGGLFYVPYGRGGGGPEDGPQRFHGIESSVNVLELDLAVAFTPLEIFTVAAALRAARLSLSTYKAMDTGQLIAGIADADPEGLVGDPFLEGYTRLDDGEGGAMSYALGAHIRPAEGWLISAYYRAPMSGVTTADFVLVPSNDLQVEIAGQMETPMNMPAELGLSVSVPVQKAVITPQVHWVGWSSWATFSSRPTGLSASSSDPILDGVLQTFDLTIDDLLRGVDEVESFNGNTDIYVVGVSGEVEATDRVVLFGGLLHHGVSVPDDVTHPSSLDFATTDLRAGVIWSTGRKTRLALGADGLFSATRDIDDSVLSMTAPPEGTEAVPSGNGVYQLALSRVGLTWLQRW